MSDVFLKMLNISITAGWLILAIILIRPFIRKAPKWIGCALWALVAVRLICPFSLESALSLIPSNEPIPYNIAMERNPAIDSGIAVVDEVINPVIAYSFTSSPVASANPLQIVLYVAANVWIVGVVLLLAYALYSYGKLRADTKASICISDNIKACDEVKSPFILGILRPIIYVPSSMEGEILNYVITHEQAHIKRRDHWWKPFGYLLLAVYWFNPLCWVAYILLCRDIEMACDEKVIRDLDKEGKAAYSQALLDCNFSRRRIVACPVAFGEVGVKERVKAVLSYKKPTFWIIAFAVVIVAVVSVSFMTNPHKENESKMVESDDNTEESKQNESITVVETGKVLDTAEILDYLASLPNDANELAALGCFVNSIHGVYGLENLYEFQTKYNNQKPATLVIGQYTVEGDLVFDYIYYDGDCVHVTLDSRRDKWMVSSEAVTTEVYNYFSYLKYERENSTVYEEIVVHDEPDMTTKKVESILASSAIYDKGKIRLLCLFEVAKVDNDKLVPDSFTKEDIVDRMLNSVENYSYAKGSLVSAMPNVYSVEFETDLENGTAYEKSVGDNFVSTVNAKDGVIITETNGVSHTSYGTRTKKEPTNRAHIGMREDGTKEYVLRVDPTNLEMARICLIPEEITFSLLEELENWKIEQITSYLGRPVWLLKGKLNARMSEKIGGEDFSMYVDCATGILWKYEITDRAGKPQHYAYVEEIEIR